MPILPYCTPHFIDIILPLYHWSRYDKDIQKDPTPLSDLKNPTGSTWSDSSLFIAPCDRIADGDRRRRIIEAKASALCVCRPKQDHLAHIVLPSKDSSATRLGGLLARQRGFSRWMNEPGQKPKAIKPRATDSTRETDNGYLQLRVMNPPSPWTL